MTAPCVGVIAGCLARVLVNGGGCGLIFDLLVGATSGAVGRG